MKWTSYQTLFTWYWNEFSYQNENHDQCELTLDGLIHSGMNTGVVTYEKWLLEESWLYGKPQVKNNDCQIYNLRVVSKIAGIVIN